MTNEKNGRAKAPWAIVVGVMISAVSIGGVVAAAVFYAKADGRMLEVRVEQNAGMGSEVKEIQKEIQKEQRRMDRNILRIGNRFRVRDLEEGLTKNHGNHD